MLNAMIFEVTYTLQVFTWTGWAAQVETYLSSVMTLSRAERSSWRFRHKEPTVLR